MNRDLAEYVQVLEEMERRKKRRFIYTLFPDEGPLRRELYPKHMEFFEKTNEYRELAFMAANRIGKTIAGGYALALALTGRYNEIAPWWKGRRFDKPISAWAAGKTNETTRDIIQAKLFGKIVWDGNKKGLDGTGLIPGECIGDISWKQGSPDLIDYVEIRHISGVSILGLKSYQQGRGAFEGTEQDVIWLDEEPPQDVYGECLIRTATTNGIVYMTFTPLDGMTEVASSFLPGGKIPSASS